MTFADVSRDPICLEQRWHDWGDAAAWRGNPRESSAVVRGSPWSIRRA